ncbi:hypothetical protein OF83DRAFT_1053342 [Amylostereum chailletii]|nr:hypothetical protein OF83DRAFT_1053342 [Amylostereum chailletii]
MTVLAPKLESESRFEHTARGYQDEIFRRAQEENIIAALATGSGKTYISAQLIRWIANQEHAEGKIVVFIVPQVPLVEQQYTYLKKHVNPLRVSRMHSGITSNVADRVKWKKSLEGIDVLVTTAQVFLNLITHSHWSFNKVSLLVFDECHHAQKDHPYNTIMQAYDRCLDSSLPKIFGMTASAVRTHTNPENDIAILERNLHARVLTSVHYVNELTMHSQKPTEVIHEYPSPPEVYPSYAIPSLWHLLQVQGILENEDIPWAEIRRRYDAALNSLGIFGAEQYMHSDLCVRAPGLVEHNGQDEMETLRRKFLTIGTQYNEDDSKMPVSKEVQALCDTLEDLRAFFEDEGDLPAPWTFNMEWCTPKVAALVDILVQPRSSDFHGIVFVDQRHIALHLAKLLNRIPHLRGLVRAAELVGHGGADELAVGMHSNRQREVVQAFRDGDINLLVATQVAEEGLDFPACDLVVRFDPLQNLIGYLQSRGRARRADSIFIYMVLEGNLNDIKKYDAFKESEPRVRELYQARSVGPRRLREDEGMDEDVSPVDLATRERFVVPSTGAVLSYNTAIALLSHLCSLIPCDSYTAAPKPNYSGDSQSTLCLPTALPLSSEHLTYIGPPKHSKKEAKRAVAFLAVKTLHGLGVFDEYLLPKGRGKDAEDVDGRPLVDVSGVPDLMDVVVQNPWTLGPKMWLHPVFVDGQGVGAIVTGTRLLPLVTLMCDRQYTTGPSVLVDFDPETEYRQRALMQQYTDIALWWCNTGRPRPLPLSCFLVPTRPVNEKPQPDFDAMEAMLKFPLGCYDWSSITEAHRDHLFMMNRPEHGRVYLFHRLRPDLTPLSVPPDDAQEAGHPTYKDYYMKKFERKRRDVFNIVNDCPLVEAYRVDRQVNASYNLGENGPFVLRTLVRDENPYFLPLNFCRWFNMPEEMFRLYRSLPLILRRITDVWRARKARMDLALPPILDDLLVEAFTLPDAAASFNNQRLETLGDEVLKVCTSVHLFNKFPYRHEGQLDVMRTRCISNRTLLAHAKEIDLECYLSNEPQNVKTWPYVMAEGSPAVDGSCTDRRSKRRMARRSLQDCMEATLGASWLTGGIEMSLHAGTALGLNFGGTIPWTMRYSRDRTHKTERIPGVYGALQEQLQYRFQRLDPLSEALRHPSYTTGGASYQRLEFLGDALIDLAVMTCLYKKFPQATSGQLSCMRRFFLMSICAPVFAWVAVGLGLHNLMNVSNMELSNAMNKYAPILRELSPRQIIEESWAHDPPKAVSDVLESLVAAILVDSMYNLEKTNAVIERIMMDILEVLTPDLRPDPVSELMVWVAQAGCRRICIPRSPSNPDARRVTVKVVVHDVVISSASATTRSVAKAFASDRARKMLQDTEGRHSLERLCKCGHRGANEDLIPTTIEPTLPAADDVQEKIGGVEEDETEAGFAEIAQQKLEEFVGPRQQNIQVENNDDVQDEDILADNEDLDSGGFKSDDAGCLDKLRTSICRIR